MKVPLQTPQGRDLTSMKPSLNFEPILVQTVFRQTWSSATSSLWRREVPARGQCSVTALVVHRLFSGDILKTDVEGAWHYYNRLGGKRFDFTAEQFPSPPTYADVLSNREDAFQDTTRRQYWRLLAEFNRAWQRMQTKPHHMSHDHERHQ